MVTTIGNCLKGSRKLFCDNSVKDAIDDGSYYEDPGHLREKIIGRILKYTETAQERNIRVRAEWEALQKRKNQSCLDFEAEWENAHRNMQKAGLVRAIEEEKVDYLRKVGEVFSRAIRRDRRPYDADEHLVPRNPMTWQERRMIACESRQPSGRRRSNDVFLPSSKSPFFPFGEGFTPPLDLDGGFREVAEGPFWPKMAPRGPQRAQDGLQDRSR